ncbi:MAG: PQQ-binding-like beta-propeller repeat protein [Pirellulaceae bacterium]
MSWLRQLSARTIACGFPLLLAGVLSASDWPQILGPQRSGQAEGETLAANWTSAGPKKLWTYKLGSGYAGPAIAAGKVVVFHRVAGRELVEALDPASGKRLWSAGFEATYRPGIDPDNGPRAVPLIAGKRVFVFGAAGDLRAVSLADGQPLWERHLYADYEGDEGYFGAASTPILIGERLLVNVGGPGAGIVAVDPATGKTLWQASDEGASYSSPTAVTLGGKEQAIFITRMNCVLADPATGKVLALFPFGRRGPTVNGATPLVFGDKLFVTSSYGVGAQYATLGPAGAKEIWANDDAMSSQYSTPVEHQGFLYGTHGREDQGVAELRSIEAATGKVRWRQTDYGVAHVILAGDKLLLVGVGGRLALARASPAKYEELARFPLGNDPARAIPALSDGRLFVRTGSGGGKLHCLQVGPE